MDQGLKRTVVAVGLGLLGLIVGGLGLVSALRNDGAGEGFAGSVDSGYQGCVDELTYWANAVVDGAVSQNAALLEFGYQSREYQIIVDAVGAWYSTAPQEGREAGDQAGAEVIEEGCTGLYPS